MISEKLSIKICADVDNDSINLKNPSKYFDCDSKILMLLIMKSPIYEINATDT